MSAQNIVGNLIPSGDLGNKTKSVVLISVMVLVIVIVIIVIKKSGNIFDTITGGINSMLEGVGILDSAEDKKADADVAAVDTKAGSIDSPFNPNFHRSAPSGTTKLSDSVAEKLADQVYDSVGIIYDDPESGFGAIKQAKSWVQVSQIADALNSEYGKDLYSWLKIKYDTTAQKDILAKLVNYAFNLPKY